MTVSFLRLLQILACSFLLCMLMNTTIALTVQPTDLPRNLNGINYPEKNSITEMINLLYVSADTKKDTYSLSLPLMAAAQQGDSETYKKVLASINPLLQNMKPDSFKAWLLGRLLFAAKSINDNDTINKVQPELQAIINNFDNNNYSDIYYAFYAWACGYLATLNNDEYFKMKKLMLDSANHLSDAYLGAQNHDALSNAMWAWVMDLQAAANANDKETYDFILKKIIEVSGQPTVEKALTNSLIRTATSSDYPAWAIGIVQLSAAIMHDKNLNLHQALTQAISQATSWGAQPDQTIDNQWKAKAEHVLGQINAILSIEK